MSRGIFRHSLRLALSGEITATIARVAKLPFLAFVRINQCVHSCRRGDSDMPAWHHRRYSTGRRYCNK